MLIIETKNPAGRTGSYEQMFAEAKQAAKDAVAAMGPEDQFAFDCGFAWVTVRPANHPFVNWCKKQQKATSASIPNRQYGSKAYGGGWQFWNPGEFNGQAIGHIRAGASAFAAILALYNINGEVGSRYD